MKSINIKALIFGVLSVIAFSACFILVPLGTFTIWITVGATVYFLFLTIYSLIPPRKKAFIKKKLHPSEEEMRQYIRFHLRMLVSLFLGATLLVLIILWFVL